MNAFGDSRPTKAKQDRNRLIICSLSGVDQSTGSTLAHEYRTNVPRIVCWL